MENTVKKQAQYSNNIIIWTLKRTYVYVCVSLHGWSVSDILFGFHSHARLLDSREIYRNKVCPKCNNKIFKSLKLVALKQYFDVDLMHHYHNFENGRWASKKRSVPITGRIYNASSCKRTWFQEEKVCEWKPNQISNI